MSMKYQVGMVSQRLDMADEGGGRSVRLFQRPDKAGALFGRHSRQ